MAITVHVFLDKRSVKAGDEAPLKIGINKQSSSAYISLGRKILPSQWDSAKERIKNRPDNLALQSYIDTQRSLVANIIMDMQKKGELTLLTATQVKNKVLTVLDPTANNANNFFSRFVAFANSKTAKRTREIYLVTLKRIQEYDPARLTRYSPCQALPEISTKHGRLREKMLTFAV